MEKLGKPNPPPYPAKDFQVNSSMEASNQVTDAALSAMQQAPQTSPSVKIKTIFHAIGPTNLHSDDLEGLTFREGAIQFSTYLRAFINQAQTLTEEQIIKLNSVQKILHQAFIDCPLEGGESEDFFNDLLAKNLAEKVNKLAENTTEESLLFLGGAKPKGIPHAIVYEVFKEIDGTLTFLINNTGAGIELHKKNSKKVHTILYKNINKDKINANFWKKIINFQSHTVAESSTRDLYGYIDSQLNDGNNKADGRLLKPQRAGVCAWKSLSTWLHGKIAPGETNQDRNVQDELLYLEFMKFVLTDKKKSLSQVKEHFVTNNIVIRKTNQFTEFFYRILDAAKTHARPLYNLFQHIGFIPGRKYEKLGAAQLLDLELSSKIARINKKIGFLRSYLC